MIVNQLVVDIPPNGVERRNIDLMSLLLSSKMVYGRTIGTLYRQITIPHSRIFQKFLEQITLDPGRGTWVRRLDFSHFNPSTLFSDYSNTDVSRPSYRSCGAVVAPRLRLSILSFLTPLLSRFPFSRMAEPFLVRKQI